MQTLSLNGSDWTIKEFVGLDWVWRDSVKPNTADTRWWLPATVPGSVMQDLWQAGKVPNPYQSLNSKLVEWVPARTWVYRKSFAAPEWHGRVTLCLNGIDYSGEIFLNGESLGRHTGMFTRFEQDITERLLPGENLLAVVLDAAPPEQPQVGRSSLVHTHKSRMTYWWDFCPRMIHLGMWDNAYLHLTGPARIHSVYVYSTLDDTLQNATVTVETEADAPDGTLAEVAFGELTATARVLGGRAGCQLTVQQARLWWPNGHGEQHLYPVTVTLRDNKGQPSDTRTLRHGIRKLEWAANDGADASLPPYTLLLNNTRVYVKGINWVPVDVLYGVQRPQKLARLIRMAREAGILMLRVWGGGLIERDDFYEACTDAGILVWQEFIQSSSGIENRTPDDPAQIQRMQAEAVEIVKRKRSHTALAVWGGGNELQQDDGMPLEETDPMLAALGGVVKLLDPQRRWLPTSPYGGYFINSLENIEKHPARLADVHGLWEHQGLENHYRLYNAGTALFSSEFGVEGMANPETLREFLQPDELMPAGKDNEVYFHRGAWWNNEPLVQQMFGGGISNLDALARASGHTQFEGLRYALECNLRRAFQSGGSFPWQFNEPYPNCFCTSTVDYQARPKPGYYAVKSAYRPFYPAAEFASARLGDRLCCTLHLISGQPRTANICYHVYVNGGFWGGGNQTVTASKGAQNAIDVAVPHGAIILLRLEAESDGVCQRNEYLFTSGGSLQGTLAEQRPRVEYTRQGETLTLHNKGNAPAYGVWLYGDGLYIDENCFTLLAGEKRQVKATGTGVAALDMLNRGQ